MRQRFSALSAIAFGLTLGAPLAYAQDPCEANLAASRNMAQVVSDGFAAIKAKDRAAQDKVLPQLEAAFNKLAAAEIKPVTCTNAHIDTYTPSQFTRLSLLRANGVDTGFPTDVPIVKQPRLNQENLAFAVGWIRYERTDYAIALSIFEKGLKMYPDSAELQNEYLATLMQLKRYADLTAAAEQFLLNSYLMTDETRAKVYQAMAIAQTNLNQKDAATQSAQVAVYYDSNDSTLQTQQQVTDAFK
ncbi:MAG: hypothetical protein ABMA14_17685 [Hyphomonadaceae bacterium]